MGGNAVIVQNTGSTSTAALTFSQEGAWVTGSGNGRFSIGTRFNGEFAFYDWGQQADTIRLKDGLVAIGGSFNPARIAHVRSGPDLFFRLETTGSSTADQIEYLRGASYTWFGPTAGNEFHLWSQENMPFVVGLNNAEVGRFHPEKYFETPSTNALSTGSSAMGVRSQNHTQTSTTQTYNSTRQMTGYPAGYYAVWTNDPNEGVQPSGSYAKVPWLGGGGNLEASELKYIEVDTLGGTDITFNRLGRYEIHAQFSVQLVSGSAPATVHGYLENSGSEISGTDMYATCSDLWSISTASCTMVDQFQVGETLAMRLSVILGSGGVNLAPEGTGAKVWIRQIGYF